MPYLNLHLTSDKLIAKEDLTNLTNLKSKWTQKQLLALETWLCNFVSYPDKEILFTLKNIETIHERHNPKRIGNRPIVAAIKALEQADYIKISKGIPRWAEEPAKLSSVVATDKVLALAEQLNITPKTTKELTPKSHVRMRTVGKGKKSECAYKDTDYTRHVEQLMREYCEYLNSYHITCGDIGFSDIHLYRNYQARRGNNFFQFGGRSGGYWMSLKRNERPNIKINNKPTVSCDYPFSQTNILYHQVTGKWKDAEDDAYALEGIDNKYRPIIKTMTNIMYNTSWQGVAQAVRNYFKEQEPDLEPMLDELLANNTYDDIKEKIITKHKPINHLFCCGADFGQVYAFIEANNVFEVAVEACRRGVPCLTVHDEFIVRKEDEGIMWELMYSTYVDKDIYKHIDLTQLPGMDVTGDKFTLS